MEMTESSDNLIKLPRDPVLLAVQMIRGTEILL